jgi:hypothetical protein
MEHVRTHPPEESWRLDETGAAICAPPGHTTVTRWEEPSLWPLREESGEPDEKSSGPDGSRCDDEHCWLDEEESVEPSDDK